MNLPNETIQIAHQKTIQARQRVAVTDDPTEPAQGGGPSPHELLQRAVAMFYETLRSHLVETPEGRRFFYGEVPDEPDEEGYGVLSRALDDETYVVDDLPGDLPADATGREKKKHIEEILEGFAREHELFVPPARFDTADDGAPIVTATYAQYEVGLRRFDDLFDRRVEVEQERATGFMKSERSRGKQSDPDMRIQLAPLGVLVRGARELDRAGRELGLLAEAEESDLKPHMREFDVSNGETAGDVAHAEVSGSPDV
jgi:hypothetical protein